MITPPARAHTDHAAACLAGGGEMGERMRAFDWSRTAIGPVESWSPALRMMVRLLLANRFPLLLWWGREYVSLYNDPYRPILGAKHPWALGQPARVCWSEIWHVLQPLIDTPFRGGPATWNDDILLELNRHGFVEETHFTIARSPVPDETVASGIGGVLATVHEITGHVVGQRRLIALRDLGIHVGEARNAEEACAIAARTLSGHGKDVPFALLYLIDAGGDRAHLAGAAGVAMGEEVSPLTIDLRSMRPGSWPSAAAIERDTLHVVEHLDERFASVPRGPWSDPPNTAIVAAIPSTTSLEPVGVMVAGVSARLALDEYYRDFLELVRRQVATAIATARGYEEERARAEALAEIDRARTLAAIDASEAQRRSLSRELHDEMGQELTALVLGLKSVWHSVDDVSVRERVRRLQMVAVQMSRDMHRIALELRPGALDDQGLQTALSNYVEEWSKHADITVDFQIVGSKTERFPPHIETTIYRIVQEALTNVRQHAKATAVSIVLQRNPREVVTIVEDDGIGFDPAAAGSGARGGIGLLGMKERAALVGGTCHIESEPNGTSVFVKIPLLPLREHDHG